MIAQRLANRLKEKDYRIVVKDADRIVRLPFGPIFVRPVRPFVRPSAVRPLRPRFVRFVRGRIEMSISNVQWKLSATLSSNSKTRQPLDQFEPDDNVPISNEDTAGSVHSQ
uniref:Uncharacterized protein n=1 Tax=Caenorhabditis japonica TaxID=281687 RepID=A0A8R1IVH8_CAEJA